MCTVNNAYRLPRVPPMTSQVSADTNKHSIVRINPLEPTIFHEPWWLDVATGGRWDVVEAVDNGRVVGRMPFVTRHKLGFSIGEMPRFTHFLGPAVDEGNGKSGTQLLKRLDITHELISKLPDTILFYVKCHRGVTDTIPFISNGFRASVQFTHEIAPQPADLVWKNMRDKGRNNIRHAREVVTVDSKVDPDEFIANYRDNLAVKGKQNWMDETTWRQLIGACIERGRGAIYGAREADGKLACAMFTIWDNSSYYYFNSTRRAEAHRGAINLLLWEGIQDAMARGCTFDFDGAPNEGSFRLATNFTADISPRYIAIREGSPMRLYRAVKSIWCAPNYFE